MARARVFPFEPRSTAHVEPGDFWAIPTRRGGWYCCGRVLAVDRSAAFGARTAVDVGLMDWCEPNPPTADALAGAGVLLFARAHVRTIRETGGKLLGHRPLEADGGLLALLGGPPLRGPDERTWGYMHIELLAHSHFGRHFPDVPGVALERPSSLGSDG